MLARVNTPGTEKISTGGGDYRGREEECPLLSLLIDPKLEIFWRSQEVTRSGLEPQNYKKIPWKNPGG